MNLVIKVLKKPIAATLISIILGFVVLTGILLIANVNPVSAYEALFYGMFGNGKNVGNLIVKSTPIMLTGLGVAFAYKTGLFNIGAEGQYIMGTITTIIVASTFKLPPVLLIPIVIICGAATGAVWGAICGYLKAKFCINEVITAIMLNWVAFYLNNYVAMKSYFNQPHKITSVSASDQSLIMLLPHWKKSVEGKAFLRQMPWLREFMSKDINFGIIIAIVLCLVMSYLLYNTAKGYELRAVGFNSDAAQLAGINVNRNLVLSMAISGAICALAGVCAILGTGEHRIAQLGGFENNGFNGLAVAFIAMGSPIGCIFSGFLFGALLTGGAFAQGAIGTSSEIINIMIGTIVFFVALSSVLPSIVAKLEKMQIKKQQDLEEASKQ